MKPPPTITSMLNTLFYYCPLQLLPFLLLPSLLSPFYILYFICTSFYVFNFSIAPPWNPLLYFLHLLDILLLICYHFSLLFYCPFFITSTFTPLPLFPWLFYKTPVSTLTPLYLPIQLSTYTTYTFALNSPILLCSLLPNPLSSRLSNPRLPTSLL